MDKALLNDLTRPALIKHYLILKNDSTGIIDAANALYGFIEDHYEYDEELASLLEVFDNAVNKINLWIKKP